MKISCTDARTGKDQTTIDMDWVRVKIAKTPQRCAITIHISETGIVIDGSGEYAGQLMAIDFNELVRPE